MERIIILDKHSGFNHLLRGSLTIGPFMDSKRMRPLDASTCRWLEFGITKGITDPMRRITALGIGAANAGLHAELLEGFENVDPYPICYNEMEHDKGFGDFTRWVYFSNPQKTGDVLGLDFSLSSRPTAGVANSLARVLMVLKTLQAQGLEEVEVALLNWRMCQDRGIEAMLESIGLNSFSQWLDTAADKFGSLGPYCPRCGLRTLDLEQKFCSKCGCKPELIRKEFSI